MSKVDDQRRSPRHQVDLFVEEVNGEGTTYLHPAVDLSIHGIYLLLSDDRRAFDGQRTMDIAFTLPGGHHVKTGGHVVHVDDYRGRRGVRVAFNAIGEEHLDAIRRFMDSADTVVPARAAS